MFQDPATIRAKRESVFRTGRLLLDDGREAACRVRNMSAGGARVDHQGELRDGMAFRIAIGRDPAIEARVMWVSDRQAGIAFGAAPGIADEADAPTGPSAGWLSDRPDPYRRRT